MSSKVNGESKAKCELVVAGPGAGKTHNMVEKILDSLDVLHPTRFCAVITYTNAATHEIKSRLSRKINIPSNVFIGTIHGFLNQFIFSPYAAIKNIIPNDFFLIDKVKLNYTQADHLKRISSERKKAEDLVNKGIITYDKLLEKSKDLMNDHSVAMQVANRLQFIFIDEYQDIRTWQHEIFIKILEQNKTHFYCIGDPLQSIFKFSYTQSQNLKEKAPKELKETPIFLLEKKIGRDNDFKQVNNRSSPAIIDLISKYSEKIDLQQETKKQGNEIPIYAFDFGVKQKIRNKTKGNDKENLDSETINRITKKFNDIIIEHKVQTENNTIFKLVLADSSKTIEKNEKLLSAKKLSKNNANKNTYFQEISKCVLNSAGYRISEVIDTKNTNEVIKYRKFCVMMLKTLQKNPDINLLQYIQSHFKSTFNKIIGEYSKNIDTEYLISNLVSQNKNQESIKSSDDSLLYYSSIHSAKGLEATNVLVIAKTNKELNTWLDFGNCLSNNDDNRLGYVAFSRAKELLCIACLEEIDLSLRKKLEDLNVKIQS